MIIELQIKPPQYHMTKTGPKIISENKGKFISLEKHDQRIAELIQNNNELLERARRAEIQLGQRSKFKFGQLVKKKGDKGQWHGRVCGFYSTDITPEGYAVESLYEAGSVQIYPVSALEEWDGT